MYFLTVSWLAENVIMYCIYIYFLEHALKHEPMNLWKADKTCVFCDNFSSF